MHNNNILIQKYKLKIVFFDHKNIKITVSVKLGVGVALVVVAHLVLVKRSKSSEWKIQNIFFLICMRQCKTKF